jgi:ssDNA-binding Zn-finger/Zn-ribbon topoisomerase 1
MNINIVLDGKERYVAKAHKAYHGKDVYAYGARTIPNALRRIADELEQMGVEIFDGLVCNECKWWSWAADQDYDNCPKCNSKNLHRVYVKHCPVGVEGMPRG